MVVHNSCKYSCQGLGHSAEGRMSASQKPALSRVDSHLAIPGRGSGIRRRRSTFRGRPESHAEKEAHKCHPRAGVTERMTGECRSQGPSDGSGTQGAQTGEASFVSEPATAGVGRKSGPTSLGESPCEGPGWAGADGESCPESSDADPAQEPPRQRTATKTASRPSERHLTLILFLPSVTLFLQCTDRRNRLS